MATAHRRISSRVAIGVIGLVAGAALVGCSGGSGGSGDEDGSTASTASTTPASTTPAPTTPASRAEAVARAFGDADDTRAPGSADIEGFQTLVSGDLLVEVPGDWEDIDLEPGTGGETSIRAAPALSEFGNGGVGLGVSVYEEAYQTATVFDTLEAGLSTDDFAVPVTGCADEEEVAFPANPEMDATIRVHGGCAGADPAAVHVLGSFTPNDRDDLTVGVYAYAMTDQELDDLIDSLASVSVAGF